MSGQRPSGRKDPVVTLYGSRLASSAPSAARRSGRRTPGPHSRTERGVPGKKAFYTEQMLPGGALQRSSHDGAKLALWSAGRVGDEPDAPGDVLGVDLGEEMGNGRAGYAAGAVAGGLPSSGL